jgi:zinc protease
LTKRNKRAAVIAAVAAMAVAGGASAASFDFLHILHKKPPAPATQSAVQPPAAPVASGPSDVPADPAIRTGVLSNGMHYVIQRNASPKGQVSLRLRIAAGSLEEAKGQEGLMHFIEHMAFEGSTHVPRGEMLKTLERHGLAFGPDTNAFTNFDQTVYELDLPEADPDTLNTGLTLMREVSSELTLDQSAMDKERGVILSEERLRDTPSLHIARQQYDFYLKGQLPPERFPIGDVNIIKTANRDKLRALYDTYYRPDRTTLIVVGDVDVDQMAAKIQADFGDWKAKAPDKANPDLGAVESRNEETHLMVEAGGPTSLDIAWINQPDLRPDSLALRREHVVRELGFAVLDRRFERLARGDNPPFLAAGAARYTDLKTADVTQIAVNAQPGHWQEALAAADEEARQAVAYGVSQGELDREIAETRTALQEAVEGAATRKTPQLANEIVEALNDDDVITSPQEDLREFEADVKDLKADEVSKVLKTQFAGQGPLVFMTTPSKVDGGEKTLAQAFSKAQLAQLAPPKTEATKAWAYVDFGQPGKVAERKEVLDLDTTFVRFDNGVRLTVKPTKFRDDQVLVSVRAGDGYQDLPRDKVIPTWAASSVLSEGGVNKLTAEEMEQVLASKVYGAALGVGEDSFTLSGGTRKEDLELQLQVLAAYMTDAAWRTDPFERMRTYGETLETQLASTPQGVFSREGQSLLHGGDPRWAFPSKAQMAAGKLADLKAAIGAHLNNDPIEVVIVGDVNVDDTIEMVGQTFGALPARKPERPPAEAAKISFPAPNATPVRLTHNGRADQAMGFVAWPTTDFPSDPQGARDLRALEQVMQLRLVDDLRMKKSLTYSPQTSLNMAWSFPGYGYVSAAIEAPPDKLDDFFASVKSITADLRDHPISADELERAIKPRVELITKAQQTNEYWLGQLLGAQDDPRRLDAIRASIPGLERITAADVQHAAQKWLRDDKAWKLVIVPEVKTAQAGGGPAGAAAVAPAS